MEFGNVESFEIVVRRFDFGAFDDGKADGEENVFDLLEDLADEMVRAEWAEDAGEREVNAFASEGGLVGAGVDGFAALFDLGFDVGAKLIEFLADDALELGAGGLEPVVGDLR